MGDGPERASRHSRRCRARSVMVVVTMLVAFMMMMVSRLALTAAKHVRELIIYENNIRYSGL